jgi:hypothetical protein
MARFSSVVWTTVALTAMGCAAQDGNDFEEHQSAAYGETTLGDSAVVNAVAYMDDEVDEQNAASTARGTHKLKCYPAVLDNDGDGYATEAAIPTTYVTSTLYALRCPSGWIPGGGDCNDNDAAVHPNRLEVAHNVVDDNCNDESDEYEYVYSLTQLVRPTASSFEMGVKINDRETLERITNGETIYAKVEAGPLGSYPHTKTWSTLVRVRPFFLCDANVGPCFRAVAVPVAGLTPATVYRSRVNGFYVAAARGESPAEGSGYERIASAHNGRSDNWGWYFSTTTMNDEVQNARTSILLNAFVQHFYQQAGLVGLQGSKWENGTRYRASTYEAWCSEFYSWNADKVLSGIKYKNSVARLQRYFDDDLVDVDGWEDLEGADRADWLNLSDGGHSGMFLASAPDDWVWTLEGNAGNVVTIRRRHYDSAGLEQYGHIRSHHLD